MTGVSHALNVDLLAFVLTGFGGVVPMECLRAAFMMFLEFDMV